MRKIEIASRSQRDHTIRRDRTTVKERIRIVVNSYCYHFQFWHVKSCLKNSCECCTSSQGRTFSTTALQRSLDNSTIFDWSPGDWWFVRLSFFVRLPCDCHTNITTALRSAVRLNSQGNCKENEHVENQLNATSQRIACMAFQNRTTARPEPYVILRFILRFQSQAVALL